MLIHYLDSTFRMFCPLLPRKVFIIFLIMYLYRSRWFVMPIIMCTWCVWGPHIFGISVIGWFIGSYNIMYGNITKLYLHPPMDIYQYVNRIFFNDILYWRLVFSACKLICMYLSCLSFFTNNIKPNVYTFKKF